jgi:hypothetical protein
MFRMFAVAAVLTLFSLPRSVRAIEASHDLEGAAARIVGRQVVRDLTGEKARKTFLAAKALWTDVMVQKPTDKAAVFASLEADIRNSDVADQLLKSGFKILDPEKNSLAL